MGGGEVWVTKVWEMLPVMLDISLLTYRYRDLILRSFVGHLQGVIWSEAVPPYSSATVVG